MGQSTEHRSQLENKRAAFRRMAESWRFRAWLATFFEAPGAPERATERIRTYNVVENWVKDHRTGKRAPVSRVLDGELDLIR